MSVQGSLAAGVIHVGMRAMHVQWSPGGYENDLWCPPIVAVPMKGQERCHHRWSR
jgi:hypothetical protein